MLLFGAYEQLALMFGIAAAAFLLWARRNLFNVFLVYWAASALVIYSWAGEKMPWLVLQPLMPLVLLAAVMLGQLIDTPRWGDLRYIGLGVAGLLSAFMVHTAWNLSYYHGDTPVEMEVYTQTSPDVPKVVREIEDISNRLTGGKDAKVLIDSDAANGITWPFAWYLRDFEGKGLSYANAISAPPDAPVMLWAAALARTAGSCGFTTDGFAARSHSTMPPVSSAATTMYTIAAREILGRRIDRDPGLITRMPLPCRAASPCVAGDRTRRATRRRGSCTRSRPG